MFRKDINGLRAIAVLLVMLYHFFPNQLKSGFVGVDIFFVISGFLMTKIIFENLRSDNFSFIEFYSARINRIVPALFLFLLSMLIVGYFVLTPIDFMSLGKHTLASAIFGSNFLFLEELTYFGALSTETWLTHTWSLSLEWQFYMIYPVILFLSSRLFDLSKIKYVIQWLFVISLSYQLLTLNSNPAAAYVMLPNRAWELLLGGIVYFYGHKFKDINGIFYLGLLSIILSLTLPLGLNWTPYHGLYSSVGAALVIASSTNNKAMNNVVLQKIGFWSYSIYLWHYGVLSLIKYFELPYYCLYLGILISLFLGFVSYQIMENQKRHRIYSIKNIWMLSPLYLTIAIFGLGMLVFKTEGSPERMNYSSNEILNFAKNQENKLSSEWSNLIRSCDLLYFDNDPVCKYQLSSENKENVKVILLGDSHASASVNALVKAYGITKPEEMLNLSAYGCLPINNLNHRDQRRSQCKDHTKLMYAMIEKEYKNIPIVLISRLNLYTQGFNENQEIDYPFMYINEKNFNYDYKKEFATNFVMDICRLTKNNKLEILKPIPEMIKMVPNELVKELDFNKSKLTLSISDYNKRNEYTDKLLNMSESICGAKIINANKIFQENDYFVGYKDNLPFYMDDNHLNMHGAEMISKYFNK